MSDVGIPLKKSPYEEIKKEILEGGTTGWLDARGGDTFSMGEGDIPRKNDAILKEFGW